MRKGVSIIICFILVLVLFAGCNTKTDSSGGGSSSDQSSSSSSETSSGGKTLTMLQANENFGESLKEFVADYEAATGNKIEVQVYPAVEFDQVIRARVMSGQNFDLYRNDNSRQAEYLWPPEWPADLRDRPWIDRMSDTCKEMITWSDGRITSIPIINNSALGLIYNKKIFAEAGITDLPQTWPEFLDVCETLKQHGVVPVNIQLASGSEFGTTHMMHQLFANIFITRGTEGALQLGDDLDHNRVKYSEVPEFVTALTQMIELRDKGYINEDFITTSFEMSQDNVATGKVAMHPGADFILGPITDNYPEFDVNEDIGFFMVPFGDTPGVMSAAPGVGLQVYSQSENLEEALAFMDMFASKEAQDKFMISNPGVPAFSDVVSESSAISLAVESYGSTGNVKTGLYDFVQAWPEMEARTIMQDLMLGTITPVQMLDKIQAQAEIIAKSKGFEGW